MSEHHASGLGFLRHTVATLAYRGGKVVRDAPSGFGEHRIGDTSRTPLEILAHIADLLDWANSMAGGEQVWQDSTPRSWDHEVARFYRGLEKLERSLSQRDYSGSPPEKLFQGPIADALTHVGQIALLRRLAGDSVKPENYFKADIAAGRVGRDQSAPRREFD